MLYRCPTVHVNPLMATTAECATRKMQSLQIMPTNSKTNNNTNKSSQPCENARTLGSRDTNDTSHACKHKTYADAVVTMYLQDACPQTSAHPTYANIAHFET